MTEKDVYEYNLDTEEKETILRLSIMKRPLIAKETSFAMSLTEQATPMTWCPGLRKRRTSSYILACLERRYIAT